MAKIEGTNISWSYDSSKRALSFEGAGALPNFLSSLDTSDLMEGIGHDEWMRIAPWGEFLDEIEEVRGKEITSIGPSSFAWMPNLKEAFFPKVQIIDNGAFYLCRNLEHIYMPEVLYIGVGAFRRCERFIGTEESGSKLVLREIRHISAQAFANCLSLESVTVTRKNRVTSDGRVIQDSGSNLEYVGDYAFGECKKLSRFSEGGKSSKAYKHEKAFYGTKIN